MNYALEDRDYIKRFYAVDVGEILLNYNSDKGRLAEYRDYREKWESPPVHQLDKPLELNLELNNYCNMACSMCFRNHLPARQRVDMSADLLENILTFVKTHRIPCVRIGAFSECTTRRDIAQIIRQIANADPLDFWMITNGARLGIGDIMGSIFDAGLTHLCISLDAATQETYEKIRGGDISLMEIENNILKFLEMRKKREFRLPILRVSFVNTSENAHERELFLEKWSKYSDIIDFQDLRESDPSIIQKAYMENPNKLYEDSIHPLKMLVIKADGEILPCCNSDYIPNEEPVYLGKDYLDIMEYWNSDRHRSFCKKVALAKRQKNEAVCAKR